MTAADIMRVVTQSTPRACRHRHQRIQVMRDLSQRQWCEDCGAVLFQLPGVRESESARAERQAANRRRDSRRNS